MSRSEFLTLAKKEVKDLFRDPKIIITMLVVPIVIFFILGEVMGYSISKTSEISNMTGVNIAVINYDNGTFSQYFINFIKNDLNSNVKVFANGTVYDLMRNGNYLIVFVIPNNFTYNIVNGVSANIESYTYIKEISISSLSQVSLASNLIISSFNRMVLLSYLAKAYPNMNATFFLNPVSANESVFINGNILPANTIESLTGPYTALIIAPILMFSIASSISASSMGTEKEEKTLEITLSLPVKRSYILLSKVLSSFVVSLIGLIGMSTAMLYYEYKIFSSTGISEAGGLNISSASSIISPTVLFLFALGFLFAIFVILLISIVASSLANNIREAQIIASYIWLPFLIPYILLIYVNISQLGSFGAFIVSILPASTPIIAIKSVFLGNYIYLLTSFIANILYIAIILYIGTKWFSGERIISSRPILSRKK
ncbi:ABC transporter permease [Fervidicoccus fontis]|jgi:ABC-type Na+ efflux pump permease subunit|uniref:ABC-type sodium efflux pump system, permease component n=1 Tax=Fervidicoccus fontis (strain DSM 19380 / JCM 18336 / VKM B-2539 / Kam940) TaxID=1163730 RepID=I0A2N4_FERFK|nr:ABC transporter permease [Fervidicoccus fontis]AFH43241.1 ABC-type sodium efflux pump system, permease component [Fervidicoccus fontis Kam940]